MVAFIGILVLMVAYAAFSLGVICLSWHLRNNNTEQGSQQTSAQEGRRWPLLPVGGPA